jgi:hypothetical protein
MSTTLTKPPVFAVCLTRQELSAVRNALRRFHCERHRWVTECSADGGTTWSPDWDANDAYFATVNDALQKVHAILLDAGGVDDTK